MPTNKKVVVSDLFSVNVKHYGAIGDGVANDTVAIQAALDAAEVSTSAIKSVFVPAGKYLIDTIFIPSGVIFFGEGAIETTARTATTFIQTPTGTGIKTAEIILDISDDISGVPIIDSAAFTFTAEQGT